MTGYAAKEIIHTFFPTKPTLLPKDYPDLTGKTALITGTSAGVGKETARLLLEQNATVVVVNRNKSKTDKAIEDIINQIKVHGKSFSTLDNRIISLTLDLSDLSTIKPAVEELKSKGVDELNYVILNAGVMEPPNGSLTKQGWELQYGTNVLGHQLLLKLVHPLIVNAVTSTFTPRVIFLSSVSSFSSPPNGGLTWDFKDASNSCSHLIYGQSKAANIYQANIYGQDNKEIVSLAVHPGFLWTELQRNAPLLLKLIFKRVSSPPVYGSYTELFAAFSPDITTKDNGRYIAPFGVFRDIRPDLKEGVENGTARKMWDFNEQQIESFA